MHVPLSFSRTTHAYGRNRWFTLDRGDLIGQECRWLQLRSARPAQTAPIMLRFADPSDMATLGKALVEAAQQWEEER